MKIVGIRTFKFSVPTGQSIIDPVTRRQISSVQKPWLFLKIETDSGIVGWGEGTGEWLVSSVEATLHDWRELLVGQDPLRASALTDDIADRTPWKGGAVFGTALAAINIALLDIAGKAWGVPIYTVIGGQRRKRIRAYHGATLFNSPEDAVRRAKECREMGFAGAKGVPLETRAWPLDGSAIDHCARCVGAVRQAMGPEFDILLDCHGSPSPELAIAFAKAVASDRPLFLEEPVKVCSADALAEVSRKSPVPIATGEKLFSRREFQSLIDRRACAVLQPDIGHCGGISAAVDIAKAADLQQMLMAPHMATGALHFAAAVQFAAAVPNFLTQESTNFHRFGQLVEHDWVVRDGYIHFGDRPGLGVEVKEPDLAKLPYEPLPFRDYRHSDGSWKGW